MPQRVKDLLMSALGWLVSLVCLLLLVTWVPLSEVWKSATAADPLWLAIAVLPVFVNILLRGVRWMRLLDMNRSHHVLPITAVCAAGLGLNATMPGKVGEVARIVLAVRVLGVRLGEATMASAIERALDLGVLAVGGFACLLLTSGLEQATVDDAQLEGLLLSMAILTTGFAVVLVLVSNDRLGKAFQRMLRRLLPRGVWRRRLRRFALDITVGARRISSPGTAATIILVTTVLWSMLGLSVYLVSLAMPGVEASLLASMVFAIITTLATAVPSAPGAWGVYEAAGILVGAAVMASESPSALAAFVIIAHAVQYVSVVVLGLASWIWLNHRPVKAAARGYSSRTTGGESRPSRFSRGRRGSAHPLESRDPRGVGPDRELDP